MYVDAVSAATEHLRKYLANHSDTLTKIVRKLEAGMSVNYLDSLNSSGTMVLPRHVGHGSRLVDKPSES
ncbi:hypothetical protein ACFQ69_33100 [Streptomyces sp. NPDC056470]|uniref:hypothetical protein n=1 Tax=Streptomyces sp. NPDC056470 TaxID=3345831 RepID=UPI003679922F